jgi:hypothetical protein
VVETLSPCVDGGFVWGAYELGAGAFGCGPDDKEALHGLRHDVVVSAACDWRTTQVVVVLVA